MVPSSTEPLLLPSHLRILGLRPAGRDDGDDIRLRKGNGEVKKEKEGKEMGRWAGGGGKSVK